MVSPAKMAPVSELAATLGERQRVAQVARVAVEEFVVASMGLVGDHENVAPVRVGGAGRPYASGKICGWR